MVAADAAEEAGSNAALVYRFFATIAPRGVHDPYEIVQALRDLGAHPSADGARLEVPLQELDHHRPRGMKRLRLYPLFQALASYFVGTEIEIYFVSNRSGVFAIYRDREEAIDLARYRDLYVEGPSGEERHASWV